MDPERQGDPAAIIRQFILDAAAHTDLHRRNEVRGALARLEDDAAQPAQASVDPSQLRRGAHVTIHATIVDFYSPDTPFPVVVRLGGDADEKRALVVVRYDDVTTYRPEPAFQPGDPAHWDMAPAAFFEFRE